MGRCTNSYKDFHHPLRRPFTATTIYRDSRAMAEKFAPQAAAAGEDAHICLRTHCMCLPLGWVTGWLANTVRIVAAPSQRASHELVYFYHGQVSKILQGNGIRASYILVHLHTSNYVSASRQELRLRPDSADLPALQKREILSRA